jgi:hypothetical protein
MSETATEPKVPLLDTGDARDSFALAAAVSDRVEIVNVRLVACGCRQSPLVMTGELAAAMMQETDTRLDEAQKLVQVFARFQMTAQPVAKSKEHAPKAKGKRDVALVIQCMFLLTYRIADLSGLTPDHFTDFGRVNGIYNAWPYWREFVQNMLGRMGLSPFTIPVFRIGAAKPSAPEKKTSGRNARGRAKRGGVVHKRRTLAT